jgi:hypothetical protein
VLPMHVKTYLPCLLIIFLYPKIVNCNIPASSCLVIWQKLYFPGLFALLW